jgi:methylated-DNA-[protein]-cysteine S-methyltransferase
MSQHNSAAEEEMDYPCISGKNVYDLLAKIPLGKVSTYGDIAKALGHPGASRAIGRIIANNPNPIVIPCHRVVKSSGEIGGFKYGENRKKEILEREGVKIENRIVKDFKKFRFVFE